MAVLRDYSQINGYGSFLAMLGNVVLEIKLRPLTYDACAKPVEC